MRSPDDRAVLAFLEAFIDWWSGGMQQDGLNFTPESAEGLRRRVAERLALLRGGETGGGDGPKSSTATPTAHHPAS